MVLLLPGRLVELQLLVLRKLLPVVLPIAMVPRKLHLVPKVLPSLVLVPPVQVVLMRLLLPGKLVGLQPEVLMNLLMTPGVPVLLQLRLPRKLLVV